MADLDTCPGCGQRVQDYDTGGYEGEDAQRGHFACTKGPLTREQRLAIGEQIMAYAGEHYEDGGWDVIVECHTAESVAHMVWIDDECCEKITTFDQAREDLEKGVVAVWADREADARNSAF